MKVKVLNIETQVEVREMNLDDWIDQSGECSLGRSPFSGLVLDSPDVSRLHAKFAFESGHYYFYDLGSSNGSMLNGKIVAPQQKQLLKPGDIIRVGEFMLTLYPAYNQSESLAATVIGGAEMTVLGQMPLSELNIAPPPPETAEASEGALSALLHELSKPAVETPSFVEEELFKLPEEAVAVDLPASDDLPDDETNQPLDEQSSNLSSELSAELTADESASQSSESDFTMIQLEPLVDLSEPSEADAPSVEAASEIISEVEAIPEAGAIPEATADEQTDNTYLEEDTHTLEEDTLTLEEDTLTLEEDTLTLADHPSEPLTFIQLDELTEVEEDASTSMLHSEVNEDDTLALSNLEPDTISDIECESSETSSTDEAEVSDAYLSESLLQSDDSLEEQDGISTQSLHTLNSVEKICETEEDVDSESEPAIDLIEENLGLAASSTEIVDTEMKIPDNFLENTSANSEEPETEITETAPNTYLPAPTEQQPALAEKYVALLAHDSQSSALAELVANHKTFLTHCLTIATPSISQVLKQQVGFEVSCQTPAMPVGGYQTINSLITADKVSAVIFLRDFLDQANSVNDEAFSRSCNIHQVLFASNFPTAGILMQYLQNAITK